MAGTRGYSQRPAAGLGHANVKKQDGAVKILFKP